MSTTYLHASYINDYTESPTTWTRSPLHSTCPTTSFGTITCPCTYQNYSTTSTNHNNFKTTTTSPSTRCYTKVSPTTASPSSRLQIFPCNTNYYSTTTSLPPAKHLHHRNATTTAFVAVQTSSTHSLPTTMQAWTTASAKSRTTESNTGLSTPDLQVELQLRAVLRHRTTR